jgi:hypothetical protein
MAAELNLEERVQLTRAAVKVLGAWGVTAEQQGVLLGLGTATRQREMNRYRLGGCLPGVGDVYARVELLLQIDAAIRLVFPHCGAAADLWVTTPLPRFGGLAALDVMIEDGLNGMQCVMDALDARPPF